MQATEIKKGVDVSFTISFVDENDEPINIVGYTVYFVISSKNAEYDNEEVFTELDRKEAVITDASGGIAVATFLDTETIDRALGCYISEVSYKKPDDTRYAQKRYNDIKIVNLLNTDFS